jgi:nucleoside-diphosphate-sugar epimerase
MKILVTGANGFLGSALVRRLALQGHEVCAMVRRVGENPDLQSSNTVEIKGDVRNKESLTQAMQGVHQVYHLAALATDWAADPRDFYSINSIGTANVLEAARNARVQRIVNVSSAGVIGPPDPEDIHPVDEDHIRSIGFFLDYEASKAIAENCVLRSVLQGMDIVTANPTRIYGPGPLERKNGYLMLINSYLRQQFVFFPGIKTPIANFVHVDDVVEGLLLTMEHGKRGESYLIGGSNVTFRQLFETLSKATGKKRTAIPIPLWIMGLIARINESVSLLTGKPPLLTKAYLRKAIFSWPVSCNKAFHELGYSPMDYEIAIGKTVEWLEEERKQGRIR